MEETILAESSVLILQDPTNEQGPFLLESLTDAFRSATQIAGIFAFASSKGVQLFAEGKEFEKVARKGLVDLIVGTDAVTNVRALDALAKVARQFPKIKARAFLNPKPEGLFHPKFCFTRKESGGRLIAESGNLTEGGLLGNWEAYSDNELNAEEFAAVQTTWDNWTKKHAQCLLPLDDAKVREQASLNHVMAREGDLPTLVASAASVEDEPETTQLMPSSAAVLIAEIPASGDRWKQANFNLDNYKNFFGAREDVANRLVVFRHVNADGTMAAYERHRPPITVRSRNFRFELAAASGISYPTNGRPIGVFVRMVGRTFFYRLLLPDDSQYDVVRKILTRRAGPRHRTDRMRRERMTVEELRREWAASPLWRLPARV